MSDDLEKYRVVVGSPYTKVDGEWKKSGEKYPYTVKAPSRHHAIREAQWRFSASFCEAGRGCYAPEEYGGFWFFPNAQAEKL